MEYNKNRRAKKCSFYHFLFRFINLYSIYNFIYYVQRYRISRMAYLFFLSNANSNASLIFYFLIKIEYTFSDLIFLNVLTAKSTLSLFKKIYPKYSSTSSFFTCLSSSSLGIKSFVLTFLSSYIYTFLLKDFVVEYKFGKSCLNY